MKHASHKVLRGLLYPTHWLACKLHKTNLRERHPKWTQFFIGLIILGLGMTVEHISSALYARFVSETVKAVGVAPICKIVADTLKLEI